MDEINYTIKDTEKTPFISVYSYMYTCIYTHNKKIPVSHFKLVQICTHLTNIH